MANYIVRLLIWLIENQVHSQVIFPLTDVGKKLIFFSDFIEIFLKIIYNVERGKVLSAESSSKRYKNGISEREESEFELMAD